MAKKSYEEYLKEIRNDLSSMSYTPVSNREGVTKISNIKKEYDKAKSSSSNNSGYFKKAKGKWYENIGGTALDIAGNLTEGFLSASEGLSDWTRYRGADFLDFIGADKKAEEIRNIAKTNTTAGIVSDLNHILAGDLGGKKTDEEIGNFESIKRNSYLGNKSKDVLVGVGNSLTNAALSAATGGTLGLALMGASAAGGAQSEAYAEGADDYDAALYGAISGTIEAASEKMFGGLGKISEYAGFGTGALDDQLVNKFTKNMTNTFMKNMVQLGLRSAGEGTEEVVSGLGNALAKKLTYMKEEDLSKLIEDQHLMESFVNGALSSAIMQAPSNIRMTAQGRSYDTGLTKVQENLINKEVDNRINLLQNENQKITETQKQKIREQVLNQYTTGKFVETGIKQIDDYSKLFQNQETSTDLNNIKYSVNNDNNIYQYNKTGNTKIDNFRESASRFFNNSEQSRKFIDTIEKIITDKDYNVIFDNSITNQSGQTVNGQIRTLPNGEIEIRVNPNSSRSGEFIIMHEVTHAIDDQEIKNLILDYASKHDDFNKALESLKATYKINDVSSEVVADISGQLFGNQEFINNLSTEKPSLFKRIYNSIISIANKITGNSNEALFIRDLKNKWENAYRTTTQEQAVNNVNNEKYSIGGIEAINSLEDSKYKQDALNDYNKAINMQKSGEYSNEDIRQETNWFQDKNGDWKFEFDDSSLTLNNEILQKNENYKLGDIIDHDYLFKLYPELKNYDVEFRNIKGNGSFINKDKTITINNDFLDNTNYKALKGTILHEVQHAIQYIEGFETGMSSRLSKKAYYSSLGETEANDTKSRFMNDYTKGDRKSTAPESSKKNPKHPGYDNYIENRGNIDKIKDAVYPLYGGILKNAKKNQEVFSENQTQNTSLVDGRGLLDNNSSFSFEDKVKKAINYVIDSIGENHRIDADENLDRFYDEMYDEIKSEIGRDISDEEYSTIDELLDDFYKDGYYVAEGGFSNEEYADVMYDKMQDVDNKLENLGFEVKESRSIYAGLMASRYYTKDGVTVRVGDHDNSNGYNATFTQKELYNMSSNDIVNYVQSEYEKRIKNINSQDVQNNTQELDNSSFSFDENAKRYEDLKITNNIEFFKNNNGNVRVSMLDSNNNLVNQFDISSEQDSIKQLGENIGNYIFNKATDDYKTINIGNDINNLGNETDYFMNHRPNKDGATSDNLANQDIETPGPIDLYEHPEYYFQMNEEYSKESMDALRKIKGKPNATVTIYRATTGNKINPGDWITLSKTYAEYHNNSQFDGKANVLEMKVKAKDVKWAMDDINEFGYFPNTNNIKNSISNSSAWQQYLDKHYKPSGTRTDMNDIKIPTARDVNKVNLPINYNVQTPNNSNKIMNPNEISKLTPKDANTTPSLPTRNRNTTNDGNSNFFSNIQNKTDMLNEEQKSRILSNDDVKYYDKITNKESLDKAYEKLNNGGESESIRWFNKDSTNADATDVAEGWILMKQYADNGNYDGMVEIAKKMRDIGSKAGQTVQAFNIMERMTPEGMVKYAQSELQEAYNRIIKNKTKEWIDKYRSDFDLKPDEVQFIMDTMKEVSTMEDGYDKRVKLAEIQKLMTDKLPPEKGAGIKSWMRISMLFNPKTQVRNVAGNAIIMPVNSFGDLFASYADKIVSKKTGIRTTGTTNVKAMLKGMKEGAYQATNDYRKGINTKDMEGNRFEITEGKNFNDKTLIGKSLNRVEGLLNYVMDAGDRVFSQAAFENSLQNQLVLNNTTEITQDMLDIARTESLQRTWNDNNSYTKFVLDVRRMMNKLHLPGVESYGLGDILIPFAKTPANLTKAIVDYSPVGLVNTLVEGHNLNKSLKNGQFNAKIQHKFVQDLGKATAGTMLYVLGYALAKIGIISGENDEDKDVSNFMKNTLGVSSYSIKIGNKSFTYDWAQPIAAPLSIMANVVNSKDDKELALAEAIVGSLDTAGSILLEQSFLQSINDVLNDNDGVVSGLINEMLELPSRAVPTFSKQIADMVDDTQRTSFEYGKPIKSAFNSIIAKIPFASKTLAPTVDTMGREVKKYGGKNNMFNVFLNPANVNSENISKGAKEIYRVYKATGDKSIMPRVPEYKYKDKDGNLLEFNSKDRAKYQKISGRIVENTMRDLLKNSNYKSMSNEDKAKVISDVVNYSYNKAREQVLGLPMSNTYNKINEYVASGGKVADYYTKKEEIDYSIQNPEKYAVLTSITSYDKYQEYNKEIKSIRDNTRDDKIETIKYINSLNLSIPQKAIFIKQYYKSFNEYNEEIVNYINNKDISLKEKEEILIELGFTIKDGRVYW